MKLIFVHQTGPNSQREGGALRIIMDLIDLLLENEIDTTLLGVQFVEEKSITMPKFTFIPILKSSYIQYKWYKYFIRLMIKVPFLKIPSSAIIHTFRLDYMLPFVLFCPKNPKVLTSDEPLGYARLHYPKPLFNFIAIIYHIIESCCLRRIDRLITDENTKKYFEMRYPWLKDKIEIRSAGIDADKFKLMDRGKMRKKYGFESNEKVVLFVGRLEKIKNLDFLMRSFTLINERISHAKLVLVGSGSERTHLEKLANKLNLKDKIVFMGEISSEKMPEIYNCADLLALCSKTEGSPTVVRESLACGTPVVSTDVGDVRDVIKNDKVGRIAEREEKKFAEAIVEVLDMVDMYPEKIREACRKTSVAFGLDRLGSEMIKIYEELNKEEQLI